MKMNKAELEFLSLLGKFFTDYLPISMNASPNTIKFYKCTFRRLFYYLNDIAKIDTAHITFEMLDFDMLTNFFDWLIVDQKNSRTTAKIRHGALSSFAEYAQNRNLEAGYVFRSSLEKIYKKSFRRIKGNSDVRLPAKSWRYSFLCRTLPAKLGGEISSFWLSCMPAAQELRKSVISP